MLQDRPHNPLLPPSADAALVLLQAAAVPLVHVDAAGCVQWANDAAWRAAGLMAEHPAGTAFTAWWADPAAAAAVCSAAPGRAELQMAHPATSAPAPIHTPTPADAWFQVHSRPLPAPAGGWAMTLQPLAPQHALRAKLAQRTELLGQAVHGSEPHALTAMADDMESQLALAVELGGIGLFRHDFATDTIHCNRQGWLALGLEPRAGGLPADQVRALLHPEDLPRVVAAAQTALDGGQAADVEARVRHADGSWRTHLTRRMVQRDVAGRPIAFLGVVLDTTERQAQRRRADDVGRRFEAVTRAAGIGHWVREPGQGRPFWSDQLRTLYGLEPQAPVPTVQEWLAHFVHPEDLPRVQDTMRRAQKSGQESLKLAFRVRRVDGEVREVFSHSQREAGAEGPLLFGVVIDLTERRRSEMALKSAQDRVALAARAAGLGTWELDLATGDLHWDEQMWRLRGLAPQPVPMGREERLACVHPDDRGRAESLTREALANGSVFELEFRVLWPDGGTHWLASRSMEINDPDPDGAARRRRIGVTWDVTDIRTADTMRQEREIALRESASKSKFLARMSHELRTPLNAVLGFAELLLTEEAGSDDAAASRRRRLEHIRGAGQHLLTLINDVLSLSALEGGEVRITLQPVALRALVEQTLPMVAPLQLQQLQQQGQPLNVTLGALDLHVLADATRLRQVLLNLLSNAIKYNKPGGSVRVEALRRGASVLLRVADTGRGMSDEQLRHLFEPFNRLGADRGEIEGTGIGLAITKALVESMGGSVHVDSRQGEGSVFELRLPAAEPPVIEPMIAPLIGPLTAPLTTPMTAPMTAPMIAPDAAPEGASVGFASPPPAPHGQHRVLYIEDNSVNALIISELVARRSDLALQIAVDGTRGVQQAQALLPDLILLDMQLPDFDGFEVLRRLQALPQTARIPCIALSANAMPADIDRALKAGMSDYWTKPLDFKVFMDSLDRLFGKAP